MSDIKAQLKDAAALLAARKFADALYALETIAREYPGEAEPRFQLGRILLELHHAKDAVHWFEKAAALKPSNKTIHLTWAESVALGGSEADRSAFTKLLKSADIEPALRVNLQDRFGSRRTGLQPSTGGVPRNLVKQFIADLTNGEYASVERGAAKALKQAPKSALVFKILAEAQASQGKSSAISSYNRALKLEPQYSEAYDGLGRFLYKSGQTNDAAQMLRRAVILSPDLTSAVYVLGVVQKSLGRMSAAVPLLKRATKLMPKDFNAHAELGVALAHEGKDEDALKALQTGSALVNGEIPHELRVVMALSQHRTGNITEAFSLLDAVLEDAPKFADAISAKASLLRTEGNFKAASKMFRRAIEIKPKNGEYYRLMLSSQKTKPGDKVIDEMVSYFESDEVSEVSRMHFAFALAKALEEVKEDDRVFKYLDRANQIAAQRFPYSLHTRLADVNTVKESVRNFNFASANISSPNPAAPIFVTGMPRSGTTLVEQIVASHSEVTGGGELSIASTLAHKLITDGREPRMLGNIPQNEIRDLGHQIAARLEVEVPGANRITDKSILTYMHIGVLKLALPNARIIVVRRDPRDNLLSIYKNKFSDGTHAYSYDKKVLAKYYGTFSDMIDYWSERTPNWFTEVHYEKLVSDPEAETRRILDAVGLPWEDACLNFHKNKNRVRTLSQYQVRQPINQASVKGWKRFENDLEPMIRILREDGHVTN